MVPRLKFPDMPQFDDWEYKDLLNRVTKVRADQKTRGEPHEFFVVNPVAPNMDFKADPRLGDLHHAGKYIARMNDARSAQDTRADEHRQWVHTENLASLEGARSRSIVKPRRKGCHIGEKRSASRCAGDRRC